MEFKIENKNPVIISLGGAGHIASSKIQFQILSEWAKDFNPIYDEDFPTYINLNQGIAS